MNKYSLLLVISLILGSTIQGQNIQYSVYPTEDNEQGTYTVTEQYSLYFNRDNSTVNLGEFGNQKTMDQIIELLKCSREAGDKNLQIYIIGNTCPLGYGYKNQILSQNRVNALKEFMVDSLSLNPLIFHAHGEGVDWSRLRSYMVESEYADKDEFIQVIDQYSVSQGRHRILMDLHGGMTYKSLIQDYFPQLRACHVNITFNPKVTVLDRMARLEPQKPQKAEVSQTIAVPGQELRAETMPSFSRPEVVYVEKESKMPEKTEGDCGPCNRYPLINLSSNAVYWGALAPNIGLEYLLPASRWSIYAEYFQPWIKRPDDHQYYQVIQGRLEPRYWFKNGGVYDGHYLGLYGHTGKFDLADGFNGVIGPFYGAGLSYGYVMSIRKQFALGFALSAGYLYSEYEEYKPIDTHYVYQRTSSTSYIGPTGVSVSFIWTPFFQIY